MTNPITIPKFRYFEDIKRFLDVLDKDISESQLVLNQQQKLLASVVARMSSQLTTAAGFVFNVTPTDRKDQLSLVRKMKTKIDPELTKVVVPNMRKLQAQYNLAEDLYEKHKAVESVETQLSLAFPDRRGPEYVATINQISSMKAKIADQLKQCLEFLNQVAEKHVPKQFQTYVKAVADLINEHVIFKESHQFLYVSVDDEGNLVFTSYLLLQNVANDEGDVAPHLYISIQWVLSQEPTINIELNHEYEVPNSLIGQGETVSSVGQAVKAIADLLELENFSSALGVVPLALELKVDPSKLNSQMFSYRDLISKVVVDERSIGFVLRKEANAPELVTEIAAQLYKELKALMKTKQVRLTMRQTKAKGQTTISFNLVKIAEGGEFNAYDMEWLRDRFGLNNQALRKIVNIVNHDTSREIEERQKTPVSNDLSELTERNQRQNEEDMKRRSSSKG